MVPGPGRKRRKREGEGGGGGGGGRFKVQHLGNGTETTKGMWGDLSPNSTKKLREMVGGNSGIPIVLGKTTSPMTPRRPSRGAGRTALKSGQLKRPSAARGTALVAAAFTLAALAALAVAGYMGLLHDGSRRAGGGAWMSPTCANVGGKGKAEGKVNETAHGLGAGSSAVHLSWVARHDSTVRYMHMAMSAALPNGSVAVAWQQAPEGAEGGTAQHIVLTVGVPNDDNTAATWSTPERVPTGSPQRAAVWGPVLFVPPPSQNLQPWRTQMRKAAKPGKSEDGDDDQQPRLWVIFSRSRGPCQGTAMEWAPGGDIAVVTLNLATGVWSAPRVLHRLESDGGIPKVTANRMIRLRTGEWLLPFWRERALLSRRGAACEKLSGEESAGALISVDEGRTWQVHGDAISHRDTWLIEHAAVQPYPQGGVDDVLMLFRSSAGVAFEARSHDRGGTWSAATPVPSLRNPDAKLDVAQLQPRGELVVAYNDHASLRSNVRLAISRDGGYTWRGLATLDISGVNHDAEGGEGHVRVHYPTALQVGCKLWVVYSRAFGPPTYFSRHDRDPTMQGIRLAVYDLAYEEGGDAKRDDDGSEGIGGEEAEAEDAEAEAEAQEKEAEEALSRAEEHASAS